MYNTPEAFVELKKWDGQKAHEKGINQLKGYLDSVGVGNEYYIIYDFTKQG